MLLAYVLEKVLPLPLGRKLKNLAIESNNISGFPQSKLASTRKSAQIISRQ